MQEKVTHLAPSLVCADAWSVLYRSAWEWDMEPNPSTSSSPATSPATSPYKRMHGKPGYKSVGQQLLPTPLNLQPAPHGNKRRAATTGASDTASAPGNCVVCERVPAGGANLVGRYYMMCRCRSKRACKHQPVCQTCADFFLQETVRRREGSDKTCSPTPATPPHHRPDATTTAMYAKCLRAHMKPARVRTGRLVVGQTGGGARARLHGSSTVPPQPLHLVGTTPREVLFAATDADEGASGLDMLSQVASAILLLEG